MEQNYQTIVVGAGYFGCSAGYFLSKNKIPTLLLEKGEIASGASGANFGNVQVQDANMGLSLELTLRGFQKMQEMEKELNCDIGYKHQPSIIAAECDGHMKELEKLYNEKKEAGLNIKWLEGEDLWRLEPNMAKGSILAATYYDQGVIYPFRYIYALANRGREYGLNIRENTAVESLLIEGGKCTGVTLYNGETIRCEQVILASGGGTKRLAKTAGLTAPVYWVKSEAMVTEALSPFMRTYYSSAGFFADAHSQDEAATSLCIGQSHYGNMLIAETSKPESSVKPKLQDTTSKEHVVNLKNKISLFFPALKNIKILRSWVTPSPYTDTFKPLFGYSEIQGLIFASGFKSSAVLSATVGEIISEMVSKGTCPYDLSSFMNQVTPLES